ncbi:NPP1 family protein [Streptomyces brasiliscabiei]|uniref:NPP1 family protein n=1 Tax=Streptomyces brasiliscabiei TaxID=2736302 RepID=UPI0027E1639B|nr:NPP1 family protein [Streptomyces brasiliscabiei]
MFKTTAKIRKTSMSRIRKAALVVGGAVALTAGFAGSAAAQNLNPLPFQASAFQDKYQPFFDYDEDGCYPAAAVDPNGKVNGGLTTTGSNGGGCKSNHLGHANTYVRSVCDADWCAYMYALYFEKDEGTFAGHRHDWENVVVWQKRGADTPSFVSASAHGGYSVKAFNTIERTGNRAHIVYHLDGAATHAFRFAKTGEKPEAWGDGGWDRPALVAMDRLKDSNNSAFNNLWNSDWIEPGLKDGANFPLQNRDNHFASSIQKAKPSAIGSFNPNTSF